MAVQLLFNLGLPFAIQILILPVYLYLNGYKYSIVTNGIIPEHKNIWKTVKTGLIFLLISFSVNLVIGLLTVTVSSMFIILLIAVLKGQNLALEITFVGGAISLVFIIIVVFSIINSVFTPTMMFIYLKNRNLKKVFDIDAIQKTLKLIWKDLLILVVINYALNSVLGVVGFILCFLGPLTIGLMQAAKLILNGLLLAQVYRKVK